MIHDELEIDFSQWHIIGYKEALIKIGGLDNGKQYIIHFVHEDKVDGDLRATLVGQNTSGFELTFAKDTETVIDVEFSATKGKIDNEGTLVIITEEIGATA